MPTNASRAIFLLAIFGFNFGFAVFVGIAVFVYLATFHEMNDITTWQLIASTVLPIPLVNLLVARHAKGAFSSRWTIVARSACPTSSTMTTMAMTMTAPTSCPRSPAGGSGGVDVPRTTMAGAAFPGGKPRKTKARRCTRAESPWSNDHPHPFAGNRFGPRRPFQTV